MSETTEQLPTVHAAWADVMGEVRALAKGERNSAPNAGYNFRGIDAVMNAVGPILRKHRVAVVPSGVTAAHRDVQTSTGKPSREATVVVTFTVYGPTGDHFIGMAPGEAMDSGDKGTPKAMSVAMRTFLLQSLCLPTMDTDPDAETYERAPDPTPQELAQQAADNVAGAQGEAQVREWGNRAHTRGLLGMTVTARGVTQTLSDLITARLQDFQQEAPANQNGVPA